MITIELSRRQAEYLHQTLTAQLAFFGEGQDEESRRLAAALDELEKVFAGALNPADEQ